MTLLRLFGLMILVSIACIGTKAQTPVKLTLREAEEIAIKNHPQLQSAQLTVRAAEQVPIEVGAVKYPNFFASISGAGANEDARIGAGGLNNPLILSRAAAGFSISQMIYDFGRTNSLVETAQLRARALDQTSGAIRAQIILQVDRSYFLALRAQSLLKVSEQTVAARQLVVEQVQALLQSGLKSGLDLSIASYNLSEARFMLSKAENEVRAAYAELSTALGGRDDQIYELADEPLPPLQMPDQSELINDALTKRPELKGLQFERDAAYQFLKAEKALKLPSVGAIWSAGWIPIGANQLPTYYNAAGFTINIPIFNGRLFKAREAEAEYKARAVEQNLKDAENRITRDVRVAWLSANTAYERIRLSAQLMARANEALDLAQERYRLGLSSIVELSQAQLNLTIAEIESTNAKYDYLLQRAALNYQSGQLR